MSVGNWWEQKTWNNIETTTQLKCICLGDLFSKHSSTKACKDFKDQDRAEAKVKY